MFTRRRSLTVAVQKRCSALLNDALPVPAVGWTGDTLDADAMIIRVASRVALDDHMVARLERFAGDAVAAQLASSAPFHSPNLHLSLIIGSFDVHKRMRIPIKELYQLAFNSDCLGLEAGARKR